MAIQLQDWFCLKAGRDNFKPSNIQDSELILCHYQLVTDEILSSIEQRFAGKEPVKMLLYGDWGVGKTHTINHIRWWLEQRRNDYPASVVMIEIGDITKSTRFNSIVQPFMNKMGLATLIRLVHDYMSSVGGVIEGLKSADVSPRVAEAFNKMLIAPPGQTPPQVVQIAFDYLEGETKLPGVAATMGFGPPLTESVDLYSVLLAIGVMHRKVHGHQLIFVADEATRLEAVDTDEATQAHWVNANKLIFDDKNKTFGFIYTISGKRRDLPQAIFEPQLQNRLGDNAFEMKNLEPADVNSFLNGLRDAFVDRTRVEQLVGDGTISAADYSWDQYPFTAGGRNEFVDHFGRAQENAKPRDITNKLNDVAFVAAKSSRRLIDSADLRRARM